jgi:Tropinone reductase 1
LIALLGATQGSHVDTMSHPMTSSNIASDSLWKLAPKSTALVTGGTKGIGHAIVTQLAGTFGVRVLTCARKEDELQACLQEWKDAGLDVWGVVADVSTTQGRETVMAKLNEMIHQADCAHVGKLDILVNNVGSNRRKKTIEYTEEDFDYIFDTNLKSLYELTKLCHPYLKRDEESLVTAGPSSVVHIGSVAGATCIKSGTLYVRFLFVSKETR